MARSATEIRKRPGRHRAGRDPVATVRLPRTMWGQIDRWRREHGAKTRSEAIERLVEQALGSDPKRRRSRKLAVKVSKLATREIDRLADPSATKEEQTKRKRRLIKGPPEFRGVRRNIRN
jgi:metal-responsive CopG/Arc/MetJ family transcriptional regulator